MTLMTGLNRPITDCAPVMDIKGLSEKWADLVLWLDQYAPAFNTSLCEP